MTYKVGIVGYGVVGKRRHSAIKKIPGFKVTALSDISFGEESKFEGLKCYSDFKDLIGQEYLVETIQKSIELNKIPNAYIFTGIRGVGKTTTARIVAKMLNCTAFDQNNRPDLNNCDQAKAISEDRHPDVIEIDAASNTSVENAREIIENVKYNPVLGKYKVYIIDEVHMLSLIHISEPTRPY